MIITRCTKCLGEAPEGRIWTTCAWRNAGGTRLAYKHLLCVLCVATKIAPVYTECQQPVMSCPGCHISTADDYDAVYGTFIPKRVGPLKFDAPFCNACAALFRIWFMEGAQALEDRSLSGEGPTSSPSPTAEQVLAALGIEENHRA